MSWRSGGEALSQGAVSRPVTPERRPASRRSAAVSQLASKAATIKDVATRARTSIATVSYVLNNNKRYLRPELRERVLRAADALGYVKNAAASSLRGCRRGILAILVPQFGND